MNCAIITNPDVSLISDPEFLIQFSLEHREIIADRTIKIQTALKRTNQEIVDIGKWLLDIRTVCGNKVYTKWIASVLGWASSIAKKFIKLAEAFACLSPEEIEIAGSHLSDETVYKLSTDAVPMKVIQQSLKQAALGQQVTPRTVQELIKLNRSENPKSSNNSLKLENPELFQKFQALLAELNATPDELIEEIIKLKSAPTVVKEYPLGLSAGATIQWVEAGMVRAGTIKGLDDAGNLKVVLPDGEIAWCNSFGSINLLDEEKIQSEIADDGSSMLPRPQMFKFAKIIKQTTVNLVVASSDEFANLEAQKRNAIASFEGTAALHKIWYDKLAIEGDAENGKLPILKFIPNGEDFLQGIAETSTLGLSDVECTYNSLKQVNIWQEVEALNISPEIREKVWSMLNPSEKLRLQNLKKSQIVVGDEVNWKDCPGHLLSFAPFKVTSIDKNYMAILDIIAKPINLADLEKTT